MSIYLHIDDNVSHYLKVLMDYVFRERNYRNDIIWKRSVASKGAKIHAKKYPRTTDNILYYADIKNLVYNRQTIPMTEEQIAKYNLVEEGTGRLYNTNSKGNYTDESIRKLEAINKIAYTKAGVPKVKYYLDETIKVIGNIWDDIVSLSPTSRQKAEPKVFPIGDEIYQSGNLIAMDIPFRRRASMEKEHIQ